MNINKKSKAWEQRVYYILLMYSIICYTEPKKILDKITKNALTLKYYKPC